VAATEDGRYDISVPRFDLDTYRGRIAHFYSTTSPLTLLYSNEALRDAQTTVRRYEKLIKESGKSGCWVGPREKKEWEHARQLVDSSIHPDTKEPILLPFRMSAFVPTNLIVCAGMLMPNPSLRSVIFWQWMNQSLNVAVNYSNANKSIEMTPREIGTAYVAATVTSVLLAVSLTRAVPRLPFSSGTKEILGKLVPFVSVASAGVVNISCIRWKEMRDGIQVYRLLPSASPTNPPEKDVLGVSPTAGVHAVAQSAASRIFTNVPTLIIPPMAMAAMQRAGWFNGPKGKITSTLTQLTLIGLSLGLFLPPAIAYFPQRASINPKKLEEQFHNVNDEVYFNKGL